MKPEDVVKFWFSETTKPNWFKKSEDFDAEIRDGLGSYYEAAREGRLGAWEETPEGALALVILLDQVPRNIFRDDVRSFATDSQALEVAKRAVERGFDRHLDKDAKAFLYLPFEHSEDRQAQEDAVRLIGALGDANYTKYAEQHRDIIARFGRFPHRNAVLGRASTPEEIEFLTQPGSSF